jgi:hypothetical protein
MSQLTSKVLFQRLRRRRYYSRWLRKANSCKRHMVRALMVFYLQLYAWVHPLILGKTTFFVANQANIESMPPEKVAELEAEYKSIDDENKLLAAELRTHTAGQ